MKLGILTNPTIDLFSEIRWASEHGFELIDINMAAPGATLEATRWDDVGHALADAHLVPIAHAAAYLAVDNPSPLIRQAALDELRRSVDAAQRIGAGVMTMRFRGWPVHLSEKAGYEYTRQLMDILLRHGADRGVEIALENSANNAHQLKTFREIFHRLPALKLHYDIGNGNVATAESMTRHYLFALADRLVHIHLSDNDGTSSSRLPFGAPPHGGIDLLRELQTLRSFRYDGGITLAIDGARRWVEGSAALVRELWPQAV